MKAVKVKKSEITRLRSIAMFVYKMRWEGGVEGLIEYGGAGIVDDYLLPSGFKKAWKDLAKRYNRVKSLTVKLDKFVERIEKEHHIAEQKLNLVEAEASRLGSSIKN